MPPINGVSRRQNNSERANGIVVLLDQYKAVQIEAAAKITKAIII